MAWRRFVQEIAEGQPVEPAKARDALAVWRAVGEQTPESLRAGLARG